MGRTKGSKNRPKEIDPFKPHPPPDGIKGNPEFNLNNAEPVEVDWTHPIDTSKVQAQATVTDEDRALDRELERLANENPPPAIDPEPPNIEAKPEKKIDYHLEDEIDDYKPASTINEIMSQVVEATSLGCDSITATLRLAKYYVKDGSLERVGYFMFKNMKVYVEGFREMAMKKDKRTLFDMEREASDKNKARA